MARTLFLYTRDQDGAPLFFKSDEIAHFVRGPISDSTTRPCYFTGGPALRPSYTMLPYATNGDGNKPQEFFTLGLPRPPATMTPSDSSDFSATTVSVEEPLYRQGSKQTYSAGADVAYSWPIGSLTSNGLDGVRVYFNVGILHEIGSGHFDDEDTLTLNISLLVDGESVDSLTIETANQQFDESSLRYMVAAGTLRAPALVGARTYALRFETAGEGYTMSTVTRSIYMLELAAFHENTTITLDDDPRFLNAGDVVTLSGVGASFDSQATTQSGPSHSIIAELSHTSKFLAGYSSGTMGYPEDRTAQNINGTKEVVRTTSTTVTIEGAWPWNLTSGGAGGTLSFSGLGGIGDPSSVQGVGYVVTFLTEIGSHVQEGPPSAMSQIISTRPGLPVTLTGLPTGTTEEGDFRFSGKRLYRSNVTEDGIGVLQFVAELAIGDTEYVDTVRAVDLGEELQTETWIMPPSDLHGLVACHNGMLAGISGNEVCVSVPFQPHAWPVASRFKIGDEPVALVAVGEVIIVLTKGRPSVILGFEPESMRVALVDAAYPCVSPEGAISIGDAAIYPSTVGLVAIPARGSPVVITEQVMEKEEWALYQPETIKAAEHYGKYLAFYEDAEETKKAFLLDPKSRVASLMDLDIAADACCTDEESGQAMYVAEGIDDVYLFDPVDGDEMAFRWRSKTYATQRPWCPGYARVVAKQYPLFFRLYANKLQPGADDLGDETEATMELILEKAVANSKPFALPGNYLANAFEIELANSDGEDPPANPVVKILSAGIASTIEELLED
jgi:hypothetical protein